jgi:hypothetical protein
MKTSPMNAPTRDPVADTRHGDSARHLPVLLDEAMAWLDPKPGGRYLRRDPRRGRTHVRDAREVGTGRPGGWPGPRSGRHRRRGRATAAFRRSGDVGPRTLFGGAGRAGAAGDDSDRRLPGRPGGVVAATRPRRARVLVPDGRTARHADGPDQRRDGGRAAEAGGRGRVDAKSSGSWARSATRRALRARSSRRGGPGRSRRRASSPPSSRGRSPATNTTRTRRRERSRRCASRSTTSWASWNGSWRSRRTVCAPGVGWW